MTFDSDYINSQADQLVGDFGILQLDPYIGKVLDDVRVLNELLKDEPKTSIEINQLMQEVDEQWHSLLQQPIKFTGRASFPNVSIPEGGFVENYYEDEEMVFRGIIPHQLDDNEDDEQHWYEFRVLFNREAITYEGENVLLSGAAAIDEIAQIEYSGLMSVERAKKILEHYQPDLLEDIEVTLLDPSDNESNTMMQLYEHELFTEGYDEETIQLLKKALDSLCYYCLEVDQLNSYEVSINGRAWIDDDDSYKLCQIEVDSLARIQAIVWEVSPDEDNDAVVPHIALRFVGSEVNSISEELYLVPVSSLESLLSLRLAFYSGE